MWTLYVPRKYAAIYLAWEFGVSAERHHNAQTMIQRLPRDSRGWLDLSSLNLPAKRTKRACEALASRVRQAIAYYEGKHGKPLTAGGGVIEPERA